MHFAKLALATTMLVSLSAAAVAAEYRAPKTRPLHPDVPWQSADTIGTATYAKILCSAVFVSGRDPAEAQKNSAWFLQGETLMKEPVKVNVDKATKRVTATIKGNTRLAAFYGDQGCIIHPEGQDGIFFKPVPVKSVLPDASKTPWPMGDAPSGKPYPAGLDKAKVEAAVNKAFADPEGLTIAVDVLYKGEIIGEKYALGTTKDTQNESWSMGKSEMATLVGVAIQEGAFKLDDPVPVPEWRRPGDPRGAIKIKDVLNMSSGLAFTHPSTPGYDEVNEFSDHFFVHGGGVDAYKYAVASPAEFPPQTVGRYRNVDPMTLGFIVRQYAQQKGEDWLTWPQRHLFDKIGIRKQILETDPYGNFLMSTFDYGTARNWARLGQLYLQDGMWNGQRILPEGYAKFVSTLAPAWPRKEYGGQFWVNGEGQFPAVPREAYYMSGAGGQTTLIVPSHDLVVVRMGHQKGARAGGAAFRNALAELVPLIEVAKKSGG